MQLGLKHAEPTLERVVKAVLLASSARWAAASRKEVDIVPCVPARLKASVTTHSHNTVFFCAVLKRLFRSLKRLMDLIRCSNNRTNRSKQIQTGLPEIFLPGTKAPLKNKPNRWAS